MKIDLFKKFKLPKPVLCGLVMKVTSPKGIREFREETGKYHYNLHTDLKQIYEGQAQDLTEGLYWVVNICKRKDEGPKWNHYLFYVDKEVTLLQSFLDQKTSDWIVDAMPVIKSSFRQTED